ncbi:MAG: hypothetical protein J0M24_03375 [Verrucomicrobia bacterium]|nr:hypothetical protein [Verrucomicrobiota bacterium]
MKPLRIHPVAIALTLLSLVVVTTLSAFQLLESRKMQTRLASLQDRLEVANAQAAKALETSTRFEESQKDSIAEIREILATRAKESSGQTVSHPVQPPKIFIYGEMQAEFPLDPSSPIRLSDALIRAPRSEFADFRRIRVHRLGPDGNMDIKIIDVQRILKDGDRANDLVLQGGDRVEVRPRTFNF